MKMYQDWLKLSQPGSRHQLVAFRRDELMNFEVKLQQPEKDTAVLTITDEKSVSLVQWAS